MSFQITLLESEPTEDQCQHCHNTPAWKYLWGHQDNYKFDASRIACDAHISTLRDEAKVEIDEKMKVKKGK